LPKGPQELLSHSSWAYGAPAFGMMHNPGIF